jgi:hypothetical protein
MYPILTAFILMTQLDKIMYIYTEPAAEALCTRAGADSENYFKFFHNKLIHNFLQKNLKPMIGLRLNSEKRKGPWIIYPKSFAVII